MQLNMKKGKKSRPPLDFLTTPSTPLNIIWPKPQGLPRPLPGFPTTVHLWLVLAFTTFLRKWPLLTVETNFLKMLRNFSTFKTDFKKCLDRDSRSRPCQDKVRPSLTS